MNLRRFGFFAQGHANFNLQSWDLGLGLLNAGLANAGRAVCLEQAWTLHLESQQRVSKTLGRPHRVGYWQQRHQQGYRGRERHGTC